MKSTALSSGLVLAAALIALLAVGCSKQEPAKAQAAKAPAPKATKTTAEAGLPRLVDLGAGKCIPCKKMMPIIDGLEKTHAEFFKTEFIDVWKNPDAGKKYGIKTIPTQIFFDKDGKEQFRHVGFFSKEEILNKWKELGVACEK